jgi:3-hydroxyisobutyrate dehydrogenase
MRISFIGLGHMGNPMVRNLIKAGHELTVFDVSSSAIDALLSYGALRANTLTELAKQADIIFTMLQTGQQVQAVCLGAEGIFSNAASHTLFIDCSSIDIAHTQALHLAAETSGVAMLDAPVSGGVAGAEAASLTFMVGGKAEYYQRALPILENMGKHIIHAGKAGHGQAAKICNNLILGISMIAVSEGFTLAKKLGLDTQKFFQISSHASGQCWSMTSYCPEPGLVETAPSNRDYQPGFMAKMMLKDLRLGQHAAENVGASIPLAAEAAELYALFVNQGFGELDFSAIIKMLK